MEQLQAALARDYITAVTLHDSVSKLDPDALSAVHAALAASASSLTAIHGLPGVKLWFSPESVFTAFTRLRALSLCQRRGSGTVLRAGQLPAGLEELTLTAGVTLDEPTTGGIGRHPPTLVGFREARNLRRLAFVNYRHWDLGFRVTDEELGGLVHLPPRLEVRLHVPELTLHAAAPRSPFIR